MERMTRASRKHRFYSGWLMADFDSDNMLSKLVVIKYLCCAFAMFMATVHFIINWDHATRTTPAQKLFLEVLI